METLKGASKDSLEWALDERLACLQPLKNHLFTSKFNPASACADNVELLQEAETWIQTRGAASTPFFHEVDSQLGAQAALIWEQMQQKTCCLSELEKAEHKVNPTLQTTRATADQFRQKILDQAKVGGNASQPDVKCLARVKQIDCWEAKKIEELQQPLNEIIDKVEKLSDGIAAALECLVSQAREEFLAEQSTAGDGDTVMMSLAQDLEEFLSLADKDGEVPPAQPEPNVPPAQPEHNAPPAQPEPNVPPAQPEHNAPPAQPEPSVPPAHPKPDVPPPEPNVPPAHPEPDVPPPQPDQLPAQSESHAEPNGQEPNSEPNVPPAQSEPAATPRSLITAESGTLELPSAEQAALEAISNLPDGSSKSELMKLLEASVGQKVLHDQTIFHTPCLPID